MRVRIRRFVKVQVVQGSTLQVGPRGSSSALTSTRSPPRTLPRFAPGTPRPSGWSLAASPLPPYQQVPHPGFSAFFARPASSPSSSPPRRSALPVSFETVLWPRLTPVASTRPHDQTCHLRRPGNRSPQVSALAFPASLPHLPHQPLTCFGLRCSWPARPTDTASHEVRVPQVAGLPPASSRPHLTVTPLPSASG